MFPLPTFNLFMKTLFVPLLVLVFLISSCKALQVSDRNSDGYFEASKKAVTKVSVPYELDKNKALILVTDHDFVKGMVGKIGFFGEVITFEDLEKSIIKDNKQEEIGPISGRIGLSNVYKKYKKFLSLTIEFNDKRNKIKLKLINPETFDEIMVAETEFDTVMAGVYDRNTYNPLFNSLIDYIKGNSETFK